MQILVAPLNHLYIAECFHQFVPLFLRQMLVSEQPHCIDRSIISGTQRCWAFFKNMRSYISSKSSTAIIFFTSSGTQGQSYQLNFNT